MTVAQNFIIGGIEQPIAAIAGFSQDYVDLDASNTERMADGSLDVATYWSGKLRTELSGDGWVPPVFSGIATDAPLVLACGIARAIWSGSTAITLPAARRTDSGHTPLAFALVDGNLVATDYTLTVNAATLTAVTGASAYVMWYWPQITAVVLDVSHTGDTAAGLHRWRLVAEEV